jgi:glycosyltransferase involved in cell wall biosynthesis
MAGLDAYIQTSIWEGLPASVLEAMALSKPVISSGAVGNRDLVKLGKNGFIATDAEEFIQAIKLLNKDEALRHAFGENSRAMIQESYSVPGMLKRLEELYMEGRG